MSKYIEEIKKIPLLDEDVKSELLLQAQSGSIEARNKLIEHHLHIVMKAGFPLRKLLKLDIEDIINIGLFGLVEAIRDYKRNGGASFNGFAYMCVERELLTYYKSQRRKKRDNRFDKSLEEPMFMNKDGEEIKLENFISDSKNVEKEVLNKIRNETLKEALQGLTSKEREWLALQYGLVDGVVYSSEAIGRMKNVDGENVRVTCIKSIKKLRHPRITKQIKDFYRG